MGSAARRKPAKLAKKLLAIRTGLGLSQNGLIKQMGFVDELSQAEISMFERAIRVPPLPVVLEYARAANVYVEVLIDDSLELPDKLPANPKSEGVQKRVLPPPNT
jgi:transcriptional regulator with XRE-family HTH domain